MKSDVKASFEVFLLGLQRESVGHLGSDIVPEVATSANTKPLLDSLNNDRRFNNRLLISAVVLLYGIFLLAAFLIWYYRDHPSLIGVVFGGGLLSLTLLVRWLRQLWIEKNVIDLVIRASSNLSPAEVARLVMTYYELMMRGAKGLDPAASVSGAAAT
jgi:hypothetical protein